MNVVVCFQKQTELYHKNGIPTTSNGKICVWILQRAVTTMNTLILNTVTSPMQSSRAIF